MASHLRARGSSSQSLLIRQPGVLGLAFPWPALNVCVCVGVGDGRELRVIVSMRTLCLASGAPAPFPVRGEPERTEMDMSRPPQLAGVSPAAVYFSNAGVSGGNRRKRVRRDAMAPPTAAAAKEEYVNLFTLQSRRSSTSTTWRTGSPRPRPPPPTGARVHRTPPRIRRAASNTNYNSSSSIRTAASR
ncbi:hypothetical protein PR202_gb09406 [Eleusine coracana subsp. coracana]|uniref:Uncharacterized protein n=1 Tax=Eleusine coracana subsp. coracana TaxID=191504 RepID=A0AAV5EES7_ELECO|nr:hypothetical protein PR202_gb09406 [Eleusine coracana subsp. coracana]